MFSGDLKAIMSPPTSTSYDRIFPCRLIGERVEDSAAVRSCGIHGQGLRKIVNLVLKKHDFLSGMTIPGKEGQTFSFSRVKNLRYIELEGSNLVHK